MKGWKKLLIVLPLAAWISGERVHAPSLQEAFPKFSCPNYQRAKEFYLLAFAYFRSHPEKSKTYLTKSYALLKECPEQEPILFARQESLAKRLCLSEETGHHQCPSIPK